MSKLLDTILFSDGKLPPKEKKKTKFDYSIWGLMDFRPLCLMVKSKKKKHSFTFNEKGWKALVIFSKLSKINSSVKKKTTISME